MTPNINPKTREGKSKYILDVIQSLNLILKSERNGRRIELKKAKNLLEKGLIHLNSYYNEL